jgi:hypothetical protein
MSLLKRTTPPSVKRILVSEISTETSPSAPSSGHAAGLERMEVDAVEVVARLFVADRELRALDQFAQRRSGQREGMAESARLEVGEAVGRKAGEVEAGAARAQLHLLAAFGLEPYLGAIAELAHDLVERMRGDGGRPRRAHHGGDTLGHLDIEVGCPQVDAAVTSLEQHVGKDGIGIASLDDPVHVPKRLEQIVALQRNLHNPPIPDQMTCGFCPKTRAEPGSRPWQFARQKARLGEPFKPFGQGLFPVPQRRMRLSACSAARSRRSLSS